jgi:hypothetical protein
MFKWTVSHKTNKRFHCIFMAGAHSDDPLVTPEGIENIGETVAGVGAKLEYRSKGTVAVCWRELS